MNKFKLTSILLFTYFIMLNAQMNPNSIKVIDDINTSNVIIEWIEVDSFIPVNKHFGFGDFKTSQEILDSDFSPENAFYTLTDTISSINLTNDVKASNNSSVDINDISNIFQINICVNFENNNEQELYNKAILQSSMFAILGAALEYQCLDSNKITKLNNFRVQLKLEEEFEKIVSIATNFYSIAIDIFENCNDAGVLDAFHKNFNTVQSFIQLCDLENIIVTQLNDNCYSVYRTKSDNRNNGIIGNQLNEGTRTLYDPATKKYGFVKTDGTILLYPKYEFVSNFNNGIALVSNNNTYSFINMKGNVTIPIPFMHTKAHPFNDGYALIEFINNDWHDNNLEKEKSFFMDKKQNPFLHDKKIIHADNFSYGYSAIKCDLLKNLKGDYQLFPADKNKKLFSVNLAVKPLQDNKIPNFYYTDKSGKVSTDSIYDLYKNVYVFIDKHGAILNKKNKPIWSYAQSFSEYGFAVVCENIDNCYIIDTNFNKITNPMYLESKGFTDDGLAVFYKDNSLQIANNKGHLFSGQYESIEIHDEVIIARTYNRNFFLLNYNGVIVSDKRYERIEKFDSKSFWGYYKNNRFLISYQNDIFSVARQQKLIETLYIEDSSDLITTISEEIVFDEGTEWFFDGPSIRSFRTYPDKYLGTKNYELAPAPYQGKKEVKTFYFFENNY